MTNDEKAIQIYNLFYNQFISDGFHEKIATACAVASKVGAEIMVEWKEQQIINKACDLYRDELMQFNNLLSHLNTDYAGLVDVEKYYDNFKKLMEGGEE